MAAIEQGYQKVEIERAAYASAQEVDSGERVVVGVNRFAIEADEPYEPLRVDPTIEVAQVERLGRLRAARDEQAVQQGLAEVRAVAAGPDNLLPAIKQALARRASLGEVCDALRAVWGVYQPVERF